MAARFSATAFPETGHTGNLCGLVRLMMNREEQTDGEVSGNCGITGKGEDDQKIFREKL
jgi:hypothetical protein